MGGDTLFLILEYLNIFKLNDLIRILRQKHVFRMPEYDKINNQEHWASLYQLK